MGDDENNGQPDTQEQEGDENENVGYTAQEDAPEEKEEDHTERVKEIIEKVAGIDAQLQELETKIDKAAEEENFEEAAELEEQKETLAGESKELLEELNKYGFASIEDAKASVEN
mmetsp:Transcript_15598/g.13326  ORF Transcript_15598/g.13326 Transcript_15598/m.13326 type:complete len:115 (+) Transcript_15598:46-390(+)